MIGERRLQRMVPGFLGTCGADLFFLFVTFREDQ